MKNIIQFFIASLALYQVQADKKVQHVSKDLFYSMTCKFDGTQCTFSKPLTPDYCKYSFDFSASPIVKIDPILPCLIGACSFTFDLSNGKVNKLEPCATPFSPSSYSCTSTSTTFTCGPSWTCPDIPCKKHFKCVNSSCVPQCSLERCDYGDFCDAETGKCQDVPECPKIVCDAKTGVCNPLQSDRGTECPFKCDFATSKCVPVLPCTTNACSFTLKNIDADTMVAKYDRPCAAPVKCDYKCEKSGDLLSCKPKKDDD